MSGYSAFLLAYFLDEHDEFGEQVRFAVSADASPTGWTSLRGGAPVLASTVGETGARDPFLIRDGDGFHLLATDLRIWPDQDWERATRDGSRSLVVWHSTDLVNWSTASLVDIAPANAGNAWAPKAYWSEPRGCWLVFFASALFSDTTRGTMEYQRMLMAPTSDFRSFGPPEIHLDRQHDVIDATFGQEKGSWFRLAVDAEPPPPSTGLHVLMERGSHLDGTDFAPIAIDVGAGVMERAEGPALAPSLDGDGWWLLLDEYGLRGYQLFHTHTLASGEWHPIANAGLPQGARHGSLLPITQIERERLLAAEVGDPR